MQSLIKIFILTLAIGVASCITDGESYSEPWSIADGSHVPEFYVTTADGVEVNSRDFKERGAVILFFNTDCSDCCRELPEMQTAYMATRGDYEWIAIGRDQDRAKADAFWAENGLTIPYSAVADRSIYSLFANEGIPRAYIVIDRTIVAQFSPETLKGADTLIKKLNALIE